MTATTAPAAVTTTMKDIPVDRIDRDETQPREIFDEAKLQELATSMQKLGQLQAVTVRYNPVSRRYTLIMGERRWRAAQMAGLQTLKAIVMHGLTEGDPETFLKAMSENLTRADMTPIEEGRGFQRLLDGGYTVEQIADNLGKSAAYIESRTELLNCTPAVQEAINKGHVNVGLAQEMAKLPADAQAAILRKTLRGEFANGRDAIAFAQAAVTQETERRQGGLFVVEELSEERKAAIRAARTKVTSKLDRLGIAGEILAEIAAMDPEELATVLGGATGGIGAYRQRITDLRTVAWRANDRLRQAEAALKLRAGGVDVDPQAVADAPAEDAADA
ncbi:ParB/RepB/Spo0J family partition protein [Microbispora cellulosiformans]|uniref:ParB/RepB/Spo0J family partition protein n=1 Tax=Microbispora cellulosiformans TaxID=2614688 RepID=A0A5J5K6C5_9ACTN|nr:ParB/RepB/Spo0J family partition protein [Microbispora cellulosiformans]KAA9379690.1 ParB/RepB/Spo0J family partition protein [Microbispora cellulosiformans]